VRLECGWQKFSGKAQCLPTIIAESNNRNISAYYNDYNDGSNVESVFQVSEIIDWDKTFRQSAGK